MAYDQEINSSPLFSVIIPIYNSANYLIESINSVLDQNYDAVEVILVEDKSTDRSAEICNSYKNNRQISILYNEVNIGVGPSRNRGVLQAIGDYVIFLDSDDCLYNGCFDGLEKLVKESPNNDVIIGRFLSDQFPYSNDYLFENHFDRFDSNKFIRHINKGGYRPDNCWHYVINRNFLSDKNLTFIDAKIGEDKLFVAKLLCWMTRYAFYEGSFYWYRGGGIGASRSRDLKTSASFVKIVIELSAFLNLQLLSNEKQNFINSTLRATLDEITARIILHDDKEIYYLASMIDELGSTHSVIQHITGNSNIAFLWENQSCYNDVVRYKQRIIHKTLKIIENISFGFSEIYLYCFSIYGISTLRMLKENGYRVAGFIDSNDFLQSKIVMGVTVNSPSITFSKLSKRYLQNIVVIVCNQRKTTRDHISHELTMCGLNKNQIIHQSF